MIYRFRVILDAQEDVFRDIEITSNATVEDLHNSITQAFGFGGQEMACFYLSDEEWQQGEEISLFDMGDPENPVRTMQETHLDDVLNEDQTKMIYVYDFLSMWTFLVELAEIAEAVPGMQYPNLMFAHGELPEEAPDKEFVAEDVSEETLDDFEENPEDYTDLDFDENWN